MSLFFWLLIKLLILIIPERNHDPRFNTLAVANKKTSPEAGFLGSDNDANQTSIFPACSAFVSMKLRRGSTSSPISVVKI